MLMELFGPIRAHRRGIVSTIVALFLLERVRRGWNRISRRMHAAHHSRQRVESAQQGYLFRAALLYAVPFVLPTVKYLYRSASELSTYVHTPALVSSGWVLAGVCISVELFIAVIAYNLLGIYVERVNCTVAPIERVGRSVVGTSRGVVRAGNSVRRYAAGRAQVVATSSLRTGYAVAARVPGAATGAVRAARIRWWRVRHRMLDAGGLIWTTARGMASRAD